MRRTAEELRLVGSVRAELDVAAFALGAAHQIGEWRRVALWLGGRGSVDYVPEELQTFYGSRAPVGLIVYLQLRPPLMMEH